MILRLLNVVKKLHDAGHHAIYSASGHLSMRKNTHVTHN